MRSHHQGSWHRIVKSSPYPSEHTISVEGLGFRVLSLGGTRAKGALELKASSEKTSDPIPVMPQLSETLSFLSLEHYIS